MKTTHFTQWTGTSRPLARLASYICVCVLVVLSFGYQNAFGQCDGPFFTSLSQFSTINSAWSISTGDIDNDGDEDIVILQFTQRTIEVYFNDGNGSFSFASSQQLPLVGPVGMAMDYFNADAFLDIVYFTSNGNGISLLYGNGDGTFVNGSVVVGTFQRAFSDIQSGDLNGDGLADFAASFTNSDGEVGVWLNDGFGSFSSSGYYNLGSSETNVRFADIDHDHDLDIISRNYRSNTISTILNRGNGTFNRQTILSYTIDNMSGVIRTGDINNDNNLDIVVNYPNANTFGFLYGNSDGTFQPQVHFAVPTQTRTFILSDVNNDGNLDLLRLLPQPFDLEVYLGHGDGSFVLNETVSQFGFALTAADLNLDNKVDLLSTGDHAVIVYLNQCTNTCPPDLNNDGTTNTQDFLLFLNLWSSNDPQADWNNDGLINSQDFLAYLNDWVTGC